MPGRNTSRAAARCSRPHVAKTDGEQKEPATRNQKSSLVAHHFTFSPRPPPAEPTAAPGRKVLQSPRTCRAPTQLVEDGKSTSSIKSTKCAGGQRIAIQGRSVKGDESVVP